MYTPAMGRPRGSKNKYSSMERFADCHEVDPQTGCWNWTAGSSPSTGYGAFRRDGHTQAHRWSYEAFNGPIPKGMWVLHRCDNGLCVNPAHLFLGDANANNKDMVEKGRHYSKGKTFEEVYGVEEAARKRAHLSETLRAKPPLHRMPHTEETKAKIRATRHLLPVHTPDRIKRQKTAINRFWSDPEHRARHSAAVKAAWARRKGS